MKRIACTSLAAFVTALATGLAVGVGSTLRTDLLVAGAVLTGQLSLAEIALACGFADQAHMSRLFRRHLDLPPARWRDSMRRATGSSGVTEQQVCP